MNPQTDPILQALQRLDDILQALQALPDAILSQWSDVFPSESEVSRG